MAHRFRGNVFDGPIAYQNNLYGMHFDANLGGDWVASQTYLEPKIIQPTANNPGTYAYYTQKVGTTAGTRPQQFCQSVGCATRDGSVMWINVGNGNLYGINGEFYISAEYINDPGIAESNHGNHSGDWDEVFIEGTNSNWATQIFLIGAGPNQSAVSSYPVHGVHLKYASDVTIKSMQWEGEAQNAQPDLGGLMLDNTDQVEVDASELSAVALGPCLTIVNSGEVMVSKLVSLTGGNAGSSPSYVAQIDSGSHVVLLDGVEADDTRTPPYQYGINNSGSHVVVKNERYGNIAAGDSGISSYEVIGTGDSMFYGVPGGSEFRWAIGAAPVLDLSSSGVYATTLSYQNIPGKEFLVSHYASMQAAINAANNNGSVFGTVIDDRTAPYTGPGFNIPDSVTVSLAPTTYTINSTVTFNNGNNNVTAGIILQPGAHLLGAGTSTNHGTIFQPANGLNADLIATSTVGTGTANPQWWHWGEIGELRIVGNGGN